MNLFSKNLNSVFPSEIESSMIVAKYYWINISKRDIHAHLDEYCFPWKILDFSFFVNLVAIFLSATWFFVM